MSETKEFPFKPERKHIIGHDGIGPVVLAIAIGGIGGFLFNWLKMPLAWDAWAPACSRPWPPSPACASACGCDCARA